MRITKKALVGLLFASLSIVSVVHGNASQKGKIIAGYGLPVSGKSSVFRELRKITETELLCEPEEDNWPKYCTNPELMDPFTFMMAMRTMRVAELRLADQWRSEGKTVLIEPYYAKTDHLYLGREYLKWFFGPDDAYFDLGLEVLKRDAESLPDADIVVIFDLDYDTWITFLKKRGRAMDEDEKLRNSYQMVEYIAEAEGYLKNRGSKIIHFRQELSSPQEQAKRLKALLEAEGVL